MNRFSETLSQISIAICDQSEQECARIRNLLMRYQARQPQFDYVITTFYSVEALLVAHGQGLSFDVLLLDVCFDGMSGIDGVAHLRNDAVDSQVIFFTTSKQHAVEAFALHALQYLLKPVDETAFFSAMDQGVFSVQQNRSNYIVIQVERDAIRVKIDRILFTETRGHYQNITMVDGTVFTTRIKASELLARLPSDGAWLPISKSYIVNLTFVRQVSAQAVVLSNEQALYLPRGSYKKVKDAFVQYYTNRKDFYVQADNQYYALGVTAHDPNSDTRRVEVIGDIAQYKQLAIAEMEKEEGQRLLLQCIESLYATQYTQDTIDTILKQITQFYQGERGYVALYTKDTKEIHSIVEWCAPLHQSHYNSLKSVPFETLERWAEAYEGNHGIVLHTVNDQVVSRAEDLARFESQHVNALVVAHLLNPDKSIMGFIGIDNPQRYANSGYYLYTIAKFMEMFFDRQVGAAEGC